MRYAILTCTMLAAGCATTTAPVAVAPRGAPIAVSCTEASLSDTPCVAMAKEKCATPRVDTIRLVLATPDGPATKARYDYEATYACPMSVTAAD
ncbi:hypothetical protein SAMN02800694_1511 [Luteibacter sp. UNCMF331Sha3.1]|uniref:hypothetical protein n=1 Tax=Luteibacter sp. UNCMF331Sha3.1 TaxID=1502760 RepID=UPI00049237AE|nr:hypothetical protein [Luteibacter sp. UNCMF331Sha3.1]SEM55972.1 hypothetical protein SAMN02800694_1511 [Luteibacter sp. UNCMF331Sha3.1]